MHLTEDNPALIADIHALLERKRAAPEMDLEPPVQNINAFIEAELERLESFAPPPSHRGEVISKLNQVFHHSLKETWV